MLSCINIATGAGVEPQLLKCYIVWYKISRQTFKNPEYSGIW